MKQSILFTKTKKDIDKEEKSLNAQLLIKAGFIDKLTAGVYTFLPMGLIVLRKIENIIREEMNKVGGQEVLMPALTPKTNWKITNRWDGFDALFKLQGMDNKEYALGATHEEVVTPLVKKFVFSYKDLPKYVYQIQTKYRNEARAKSGLLRGREFSMKDLYSFHTNQADLNDYYEKVKEAYFKIFKRLSIEDLTHYTFASGGAFSKYSHEFQTISESGEDIIHICKKCGLAYNKEIINDINECQDCGEKVEKFEIKKSIETGNIFNLGNRFSKDFKFVYVDEHGKENDIIMGCFGMGPSRIMGSIAEIKNDKNGIIWPVSVAPFQIHLIRLGEDEKVAKKADEIYNDLIKNNLEVLYDDRNESAGVKMKDSDLIGVPYRFIISEKTLAKDSLEIKKRDQEKVEFVKIAKVINFLKGELKK